MLLITAWSQRSPKWIAVIRNGNSVVPLWSRTSRHSLSYFHSEDFA
jgi:hypothetical protein